MGNSPSPRLETTLSLLKNQVEQILAQSQLDEYFKNIYRQIYLQPRQKHLLQILNSLSPPKQTALLQQVEQSNFFLLDSFYEHLILNKSIKSPSLLQKKQQTCGCSMDQVTLPQPNSYQTLDSSNVNLTDLSDLMNEESNYQEYKELGFDILRKKEVCFFLLAGGINLRFKSSSSNYKELAHFSDIPSRTSLFEKMMLRLEGLGRLIEENVFLYIMVNCIQKQREMKRQYNKLAKQRKFLFLEVEYMTQECYGCLGVNGQVIIKKEKEDYECLMAPTGAGDFWTFLEKEKELMFSLSSAFKYIQVFGCSNSLEHVFDCYMLGKTATEKLSWTTMSVKNSSNQMGEDVYMAYDSHEKKLAFIEKDEYFMEEKQPLKLSHIFTNNSIFSVDFLANIFGKEVQEWRKMKKIYPKLRETKRPDLFPSSKILLFEKKMTDIFNFGSGAIIVMEQCDFYEGFHQSEDLERGAQAISKLNMKILNLPSSKQKTGICEIDPLVSLEGENLEQVRENLEKMGEIFYPLHISETS